MQAVLRKVIALAVFIGGGGLSVFTVHAQEAPTPTPLQISLPTATPFSLESAPELVVATPTWTPTGVGPIILEALDIANVRSLPDTSSAQLGVIRAGDRYNVTGQYVNWYQLQYDPAPGGFGWVYSELVRITGDASLIPPVDPYASGTANTLPGDDGAEGTAAVEGGGVVATATAALGGGEVTITPALAQPTFTYPPGLSRPQATDTGTVGTAEPQRGTTPVSSSDLPPIAPILILGGLGLFGLAITSIRRS